MRPSSSSGPTEAAHGLTAMQALWGQCLQQVADRGLTGQQIASALPRMQLDLVLTAHPTEAKRTIVLEHHRSLYLLLVKRENQDVDTLRAAARSATRSRRCCRCCGEPGRSSCTSPMLPRSAGTSMHYLYAVFPDVLTALDGRLRQAWDAPRVRTRAAPGAGQSPAFPPEHLGGRRPGWTSARHGRRDSSDAGRSAPARIAAAAASARRARPAVRVFRIASQPPPAALRDRVRHLVERRWWTGGASRRARRKPGGNSSA